MMRALALIPIAVLVAVPVLLHPTSGFVAVGTVAAAACALGIWSRLRFIMTAGASLALIQYAVGLVLTGTEPRLLSAIILGVVLTLVLDVSEFFRRFHGAALTLPAWRAQARHWAATLSVGALATAVLGVVAASVRIGGPPVLPPLLAAAGALAAAAGVVGAVWRRRQENE